MHKTTDSATPHHVHRLSPNKVAERRRCCLRDLAMFRQLLSGVSCEQLARDNFLTPSGVNQGLARIMTRLAARAKLGEQRVKELPISTKAAPKHAADWLALLEEHGDALAEPV